MYSENDYRLYHHGIEGQKWGVTNGPPYPLSPAKSAMVKAKAAAHTAIDNYKKKKAAKADEKAEAKREKEYQKKQEEKQKVIKSGDPDAVRAYKDKLTMSEFEEAVKRCQLNQQLSNTNTKTKTNFDRFVDKVDKRTKQVNTGVRAWNTVAMIYNSFNEPPLPIINGKFNSSSDKDTNTKSSKKEDKQARKAEKSETKKATSKTDFYNNQPRYSQNQLLIENKK